MLRQNLSMAHGTAAETVRILGCIELPGMTKQFKEGLKRRDKVTEAFPHEALCLGWGTGDEPGQKFSGSMAIRNSSMGMKKAA